MFVVVCFCYCCVVEFCVLVVVLSSLPLCIISMCVLVFVFVVCLFVCVFILQCLGKFVIVVVSRDCSRVLSLLLLLIF